MTKSSVYFFAQYPKEFALCSGLAKMIREESPSTSLHLIYSEEPNSAYYSWDPFLEPFDEVTKVGTAWHRGGESQLNILGIGWAMAKGFPGARRVRRDMRKLSFAPNSVAFVFNGFSLNHNIFLRRIKEEENVKSILVTEQLDTPLLADFVPSYRQSMYLNLFQRFFGTAYYDVFYMRTTNGIPTHQREYRFRHNPADYTFMGEYSYRRRWLKPGEVFWPYYWDKQGNREETQSVVLFGGMWHWEPLISLKPFYKRYNELLNLIREKHAGQRLVYLAHPSLPNEKDTEVNLLDLRGFEIAEHMSSEAMLCLDSSISQAYAVSSTALFTAPCFGIRTHFLYPLFDDISISKQFKTRVNQRWAPEIHPEMLLTSEDSWMTGESDYKLESTEENIRYSTRKMLEVTGVISPGKTPTIFTIGDVTPENRWEEPIARWSIPKMFREMIGVPDRYSYSSAMKEGLLRSSNGLRNKGMHAIRGTIGLGANIIRYALTPISIVIRWISKTKHQ